MHWCGNIWHDVPMWLLWLSLEGLQWLQALPLTANWHITLQKLKQRLQKFQGNKHGISAKS